MKVASTRLGIASVAAACLVAVLVALASAEAANAEPTVYFVAYSPEAQGEVWKWPHGGAGGVLVSRIDEPMSVAVDGEHVWIANLNHSIGRMNLDGTEYSPEFIKLPSQYEPVAVAVDRHHVYWASSFGSVGRSNLDGTAVEPSFIRAASAYGVAVDREHIYWTDYAEQSIGRANLDGTGVNYRFIPLNAGGTAEPYRLAVDDAHIYWADHRNGTIGRANLDGTGLNNKFISLGIGSVTGGVALDAEHLYATVTTGSGATEHMVVDSWKLDLSEGSLAAAPPGRVFGRGVAVTTEAPTVETKAATAVKPVSATLNGAVTPNGREVSECTIEYGTTTTYGSSAPCAPMPGTGGAPVAVSAPVTGLTASTEYHFRVTAATISGLRNGADQTFRTSAKLAQSITFTSLAPLGATVGGPAYEVAAEAGSGLPVSFSIDATSSSVCTISGSSVSFAAAGTCTIDAAQPGNGEYEPAPQAQQAFQVSKKTQTITFTSSPPEPATVGGAPYSVSAEAGSGLAVSFSIDATSSSVCTISGSSVSFAAAGTCTIDAAQPGNGEYEPAPQAQQAFSVVIPPAVTGISPKQGPVGGGTSVTIKGTNLSGATAVHFGSVSAASYTVKSATSIVAVSPAQTAGTVDVTVSTPNGTSAASSKDHYQFLPTVTGVSPNSGSKAGGASVTITGSGFGLGKTATKVKFGTTASKSVNCTSTTECTVVAPAHAVGIVDVRATVNKMTSAKAVADQFTYS